MLQIDVYSSRAVIRSQEPLTVGMVGAKAHIHFAAPWQNLTKTVVFRQRSVTKDVVGATGDVVIPWEVLQVPGEPVEIGFYGSKSDGTVVIPTVWVETKPVCEGADPSGDTSAAATLPVYQQLQEQIDSKSLLLVTVTNDNGTLTMDQGLSAVDNAVSSKRPVVCRYENKYYMLSDTAIQKQVYFSAVWHRANNYVLGILSINTTTGAISVSEQQLPPVGKLQQIASGYDAAMSRLDELYGFSQEQANDLAALEQKVMRKPNNLYQGEIKEGGYYGNDGTWTESATYKMAILPVGAVKNKDVLTFSKEFAYYNTSYMFSVLRADGTFVRYHSISQYGTVTINVDNYDVSGGFYVAMRLKASQDHTKLVIVNDGILEDVIYCEQLEQTLGECRDMLDVHGGKLDELEGSTASNAKHIEELDTQSQDQAKDLAALEQKVVRKANNLYQGEILEGGYYGTNGTWTESATYKMAILPVGAVKNKDVLTFSKEFAYYNTSYMFSVLRADGTFVRYHSISQYGTITINVDNYDVSGGFYVAMRLKASQDHTKLVIVNDGILDDMTYCDLLEKITNPLKGKVLNCLGDSFTAPVQSWAYYLAERTGCICNNYGVASSRVSVDSPSGVVSFLNRYQEMDTNADATIIFGGINDAGAITATDITLGTLQSEPDTTTFYGALKLLITSIKAHMPGKKIIGVVPPDFAPNSNYINTLPKVQQACREVYRSFGIPYVDLKYHCQEMYEDEYNNQTYRKAASDDYHPSLLGHIAISEAIQGGLERYIKV